MTQGERVNNIRKTLGMTLDKFGENLGVTKVAISNIEKGNRNLTDQMAKSICREFNINEKWLRTGEGEMFNNLPETILEELCTQYNLDELDKQIIDIYISLPKQLRDSVKKYINKVYFDGEKIKTTHSPRQDENNGFLTEDSVRELINQIPDTPEELERQFPPVEPPYKKSRKNTAG